MGRPLTPPLSLTQVKNACAVLGMSVKSVPGCLVAIPPILMGCPVAFWPVPAPHLASLAACVAVPPPGLSFLELHPASAAQATSTRASVEVRPALRTAHPFLQWTCQPSVNNHGD